MFDFCSLEEYVSGKTYKINCRNDSNIKEIVKKAEQLIATHKLIEIKEEFPLLIRRTVETRLELEDENVH